jgi:hypothetical protein
MAPARIKMPFSASLNGMVDVEETGGQHSLSGLDGIAFARLSAIRTP